MKIKIIAILIVIMILASDYYILNVQAQLVAPEEEPLFSQELDIRYRDTRNLGEAIAVNVRDIEPKVVDEALIEDDFATVYAFLEGYTLGSVLGQDQPSIEPLYGAPQIQRIQIVPAKRDRLIAGVRYLPPNNGRYTSLNDLGTVLIHLGRAYREEDVPGSTNLEDRLYSVNRSNLLDVDLIARIWFDTRRLTEFSEQDLLLDVEQDEKKWRESNLNDNAFWAGRGYIRISKVGSNSATLTIYDGSLRVIRTLTLNQGQISSAISIRDYSRELLENFFRVQLTDIVDPGSKRVNVKIKVNDREYSKSLSEGETIYPGSDWSVKSIISTISEGSFIDHITLRNRDGSENIIIRSSKGGNYLLAKVVDEQVKIETLKDIENVNLEDGYKFDVDEKVEDREYKTTFFKGVDVTNILNGVLSAKESSVKRFFIGDVILTHRLDGKSIIIEPLVDKEIEDIKICEEFITKGDSEKDRYCDAVNTFNNLIDEFPDAKDDDNILLSQKAYYWLGRSYEELADVFEIEKDEDKVLIARQGALDAYSNVISYADVAVDVKEAIEKLQDKVVNNVFGGSSTIEESNGDLVEIEIINVIKGKTTLSSALIEINKGLDQEFKEGEHLFKDGDEDGFNNIGIPYKWRIERILDDRIELRQYYKEATGRSTATRTVGSQLSGLSPDAEVSSRHDVKEVETLSNKIEQNYGTYIKAASNKYGVDEALIKAVIIQESQGNPEACSDADACGLMQLIPGTARDLGLCASRTESLRCAAVGDERDEPAKNIDAGTRYLKQQINRYENAKKCENEEDTLSPALAAYNAGPGTVDNRINRASSCSWDDIKNTMPSETKIYVPDVIGIYGVIKYLEEGEIIARVTEEPSIKLPPTEIFRYPGDQKQILKLGTNTLGDDVVRVAKIDLNKQVKLTIIPGSGRPVYSESRFSVRIPIEKRLIELTPKRIDQQINKTAETIEKLDNIIARLEKLVQTWKALCLATFGYITVKNLFKGNAQNAARSNVMNDATVNKVDENGNTIIDPDTGKPYHGWKNFCADRSVNREFNVQEGFYKTYDQCINDNIEQINKDIEKSKNALEATEKELENVNLKKDSSSAAGPIGLTREQSEVLVKYNSLTQQQVKDLIYLKQVDEAEYNEEINNLKDTADDLIGKQKAIESLMQEKFKTTDINKLGTKQREELYTILSMIDNKQRETNLDEKSVEQRLRDSYGIGPYDFSIAREVDSVVPVGDDKYQLTVYEDNEIKNLILTRPIGFTSKDKKDGRDILIDDKYRIYLASPFEGVYATDYIGERPSIEFNDDGTPYIIPLKGSGCFGNQADYVEVGHSNSRPIRYDVYNVGLNGKINLARGGGSDDLPKYSYELLSTNRNDLRCVEKVYNQAKLYARRQEGARVRLFEADYTVSYLASRKRDELRKPHCQDFMDAKDCKLLFNVCDPVMCPVSRFNLGGRWQLKAGQSVASTGIVGSIVLGLPNYDPKEQPIPPICVTGVLAGLKNLRSNFQGYQGCLVEAKVNGRSVGVCDKIRSQFVCETLWQELGGIFRAKTGLISIITEAIYDKKDKEGGGEYLNFAENLQNAGDSISFFTQEYATSAFAAYQARNSREVGALVCSSYVGGKFPGVGEFFDQLTKPETPPQFTAVLSEIKTAPTFGDSRYNIFYHIYAGEDPLNIARGPLRYRVYLIDRDGILPVYYATKSCNRQTSATLNYGLTDTQSLDCQTKSGYEEICVDLNNRRECGFGKVSTSFTLNYVNDKIVTQELGKQIDSIEECVPDFPTYGNSVVNAISGGSGLFTSGIRRYCSPGNPGTGKDSSVWQAIGTCGKDDFGRDWGTCWLDTTSVQIRNLETYEDILQIVKNTSAERTLGEFGVDELNKLAGEVKNRNIRINEKDGSIFEGPVLINEDYLNNLLNTYQQLELHYDPNVAAKAKFMIAIIYYNLAQIKTIKYETEVSEAELKSQEGTTGSEIVKSENELQEQIQMNKFIEKIEVEPISVSSLQDSFSIFVSLLSKDPGIYTNMKYKLTILNSEDNVQTVEEGSFSTGSSKRFWFNTKEFSSGMKYNYEMIVIYQDKQEIVRGPFWVVTENEIPSENIILDSVEVNPISISKSDKTFNIKAKLETADPGVYEATTYNIKIFNSQNKLQYIDEGSFNDQNKFWWFDTADYLADTKYNYKLTVNYANKQEVVEGPFWVITEITYRDLIEPTDTDNFITQVDCNQCGKGAFNLCGDVECKELYGCYPYDIAYLNSRCGFCSSLSEINNACRGYENKELCQEDPCKLNNCLWDENINVKTPVSNKVTHCTTN